MKIPAQTEGLESSPHVRFTQEEIIRPELLSDFPPADPADPPGSLSLPECQLNKEQENKTVRVIRYYSVGYYHQRHTQVNPNDLLR